MGTRRHFLSTALRGMPVISLAPSVPGFLASTARAALADKDARALVVIQLDGGNDGINTVVPFKDEGYAKARTELRLPVDQLIKVGDGVALHPSMKNVAKLMESGRLAIVQGVGYPNPNRSHFANMAIWHSAQVDAADQSGPGWLGHGLDGGQRASAETAAFYIGSGAPPEALRGRRTAPVTLESIDDLLLDHPAAHRARANTTSAGDGDLLDFARRSALDAYATADRIETLARAARSGGDYPDTPLGKRLALVSQLLKAGFAARVYYTAQTGYDTHAGQMATHAALLSELSRGLLAFLDDLAAAKLADRVAVLCFSEFGRRVAENASAGTDHGTAGPVILAGQNINAGLIGPAPRLLDLEDGDVKMSVDFRRVYAAVLESWLGLDAKRSLGAAFEPLAIFKTRS
jgi:uncharacterized protein (DUF1501 family)